VPKKNRTGNAMKSALVSATKSTSGN
jgi:hypothetical protein